MMAIAPESLDLPVRRAKLRPPRPGAGLVARPRLTARLDECVRFPLTLVAAPAGFGKTTLLAEWAANHPRPVAWLTLDANDRQLARCVSHVAAAINSLVPGIADPVLNLPRRPHQVAASDVGEALADALLDLPHDIVLIVDDYQFAASGDVERFLGEVLRIPPPSFHLLLATRSDPALPLARMRLRGHVSELRASDLRFTDEEARQLLVGAGHPDASLEAVAALQDQVGGWIAGLRLATLALPAIEDQARVAEVVAGDQHLMDYLVEEVLAAQPPPTQDFLLRTAICDRVCVPLAEALLPEVIPAGGRELLERLARDGFFLEPTEDEGWFRYHPLFRSLLLHQLESRLSPAEIAGLHVWASDWYAAEGRLEAALRHRKIAGDIAGAASLVEARVLPALDREDWNAVAGWLAMLPDSIVHGSPRLLLAKAWVSHFSGRSVPIRAMFAELDALLANLDDEAERRAFQAEHAALNVGAQVSRGQDTDAALAAARRAVDHVSPRHRLAAGLATFGFGCALQAEGRTDEALRFLTTVVEREEARVDAGSIRALGGLMIVHRQAGNMRASEEVARHIATLAHRHELPVAGAWARWIIGWLAYERDDLDTAFAQFSAITADAGRVHLHCAFEAMCGLALVFHARQDAGEAAGTLRRLLEMILDANALEYLPVLRGFEARLALLQGEPERAIAWLAMEDGVAIESNALDAFDHPYLTRIKVLLAEGSAASLNRARAGIESFLAFTEERHHGAHQVEALALHAMVLDAQGHTEAALKTMRRSIEIGAGASRLFRDLGPAAASLLARLTDAEGGARAADDTLSAAAATGSRAPIFALLTDREAEVLAGLSRRLSYQEIGDELFISMQTVKSHTARIYDKLDAGNRREALEKAEALGWPGLRPRTMKSPTFPPKRVMRSHAPPATMAAWRQPRAQRSIDH
jgi:LuxR family maltose regulon positive regulatory protein